MILNLVAVFDHDGQLIDTETAREIMRILTPRGQFLITCRAEELAPYDNEEREMPERRFDSPSSNGLLVLADILMTPRLFYPQWHLMGDQYAPNRQVGIYTLDELDASSPFRYPQSLSSNSPINSLKGSGVKFHSPG